MTEAAALRLILSLFFIVALILACAWITRRAGWLRTGNASGLRVIGSQSLGARSYVAMIEVEDARLVLGVTGNQISLLHTLPPAESPAVATQAGAAAGHEGARPSFAAALRKVLKGR